MAGVTRRAPWWIAASCLVVAALAPAPASGQASAARARALFERASDELRAGRFAEARDLLNQSLALAPNPGTAFNLGVAYRGTGEALRAEAMLRSLLAGEHGSLDAGQRREVQRLLAETQAEIGTLVVRASGAERIELRLDGRLAGHVGDGESLEIRVDPGERIVLASAPDRETHEARARVRRGGREEIAIALTPTPEARVGTLVLEAADPDHEVEIVGVARATGRLQRTLEPGEYRVRVISGEARRETVVLVEPRSTTRFRLESPSGGSLLDEPALWITAGALLVAGAIAVGVGVAIGPPREQPVSDPEFGVVVALWEGP